jgi:hypothetical protein
VAVGTASTTISAYAFNGTFANATNGTFANATSSSDSSSISIQTIDICVVGCSSKSYPCRHLKVFPVKDQVKMVIPAKR